MSLCFSLPDSGGVLCVLVVVVVVEFLRMIWMQGCCVLGTCISICMLFLTGCCCKCVFWWYMGVWCLVSLVLIWYFYFCGFIWIVDFLYCWVYIVCWLSEYWYCEFCRYLVSRNVVVLMRVIVQNWCWMCWCLCF
jgi:hypothetical protein